MKTLIVVHGYPPAAVGGTELHAEAHARTLTREHGDSVTVLTRENDPARDEYAVRKERRDGVLVVFVNNTYRASASFEDTYAGDRIGRIAGSLLDELRPDVAHIHHLTHLSTTIVEALARRGIPAFMTLHDFWLLCHRGQLLDTNGKVCDGPGPGGCASCVGLAGQVGRMGYAGAAAVRAAERGLPAGVARGLRRAAETAAALTLRDEAGDEQALRRMTHMRRVCDGITHFFAPSRFIRERFIRFGVPADRITYSPYGLERQSSQSSESPAGARTPGQRGVLRLGFFGSLMVSKAPHLLIEAAAQLPANTAQVHLFGAVTPYHGDDTYRKTLEPLLARPDVRWHGPVSHQQVATALDDLDAVVVPSIWPENSPFAIHEAFRAKVPVVASRLGGLPEIVEDGRNGLLFEPGDPADLRRQLERLLREEGLLDALRDGISPVRTIEDETSEMRARYVARRPAHRRARLAAIVLNFQTPDETLLSVQALRQSDRPIDDLIVVNNGSGDGQGALHPAITSGAPGVTVLHTGANLGFSGGMNAGIRDAVARGADRVLLVNSDVIVPPDCIGRLEDALDRAPRAGIAGPVMLARTDPGTIASLGISYSHATGRMRHHKFGAPLADQTLGAAQEVDAVSGCVMLLTRDVLQAIGELDEAYFFSFEDVDFCIRARRAGFTSVIAGEAHVYHEGHRSIGHATPARLYFAARNHLLLARRANGAAMPFGLWMAPIVALNVAHAFRASGGSLPARLNAVARGTRDYVLGRFGAGDESPRLTG